MKIKKGLRIVLLFTGIVLTVILFSYVLICQIGRQSLKESVEMTVDNAVLEIGAGYETVFYQGKEYTYKEDIINILCIGIDKEEHLTVRNDVDNSVGQADAIFLVSMDMKEHLIRVLAIPRDTMVVLQMYNSQGEYIGMRDGQLTLQYAYADGVEKSAQLLTGQVSNLLEQIPINAYASINVYSLWMMNEAVDGVDIVMDEDYTSLNPAFVQGETVHLTENLLENYIRERDSEVSGSAYTRIHRQKQYMYAFFEKAKKKLQTDITLPFRLLKMLEKDMRTDVTMPEIVYLISEGLKCSLSDTSMYTLPGTQVQGAVYEEFHPDKEAVKDLLIDWLYEEN